MQTFTQITHFGTLFNRFPHFEETYLWNNFMANLDQIKKKKKKKNNLSTAIWCPLSSCSHFTPGILLVIIVRFP